MRYLSPPVRAAYRSGQGEWRIATGGLGGMAERYRWFC